jgi:hypothetical protein
MQSLPQDQQHTEFLAALTLAAALKHWAHQMTLDQAFHQEVTLRRAALALEISASAACKTGKIIPFSQLKKEIRLFCD